jgi:hypothetical protein
LICRACLFFHDTTFRRHVTGRDDNDHQISATYRVGKVRHFRARLGEYRASGNRGTARIRFCDRGRRAVSSLAK